MFNQRLARKIANILGQIYMPQALYLLRVYGGLKYLQLP